ncbi:MAG TPA: hypothetical protein VFL47_06115, partial [Flavisolibacter sp.]|nr:hypothetical protein [Flavisolibacter sp.]
MSSAGYFSQTSNQRMKQFLSILLFSVSFHVQAQQSATDVLNAEKSFAAYSVQHGTKAAFLQFADSSGLVFERGKPVKAIEFWSRRQEGAGILNWYPVYGWLSQSGDLGFTTGPWTFQPKTINDSVVARGQFNTVWHKTEDGNWKFLLDMGVSKTPDFATKAFAFRDTKINFTPGTMEELLKAEERLV